MARQTRRYVGTGEDYQTTIDVEVRVLRKGAQERNGQMYFLKVVEDYMHPTGPNCRVGERFTHWRNDEAKRYESWRVNAVGHGREEAWLQGEWGD